MQQHADIVTDLKGNVIKGASVRVLLLDGTNATIYAANGGDPTGNPLTSGSKGEFAFYAPNGDYTLEISAEGKVLGTAGPIKLYDPVDDAERATWSSLAEADAADKVGATWFAGVIGKLSDLATSAGASLIGFLQVGTGAVAQSVHTALRERISVTQFGTKGDNVADDTTAQQNAINRVQSTSDPGTYGSQSPASGSSTLNYPAGYYRTNGTLALSKKVAFKGDGPAEFSSGTRVAQFAPNSDLFKVTPIAQGMSVSFEDMALIGVGTGAGNLINVERSSATCNSQRYSGMVFGTPPNLALYIQAGDDIIVDNSLFDVAAKSAIALGTSAADHVASNVRIMSTAFFAVNERCMLTYNIDGLQIVGAQVYPTGSGRTGWFIDGYNTLPYQIKNVSIMGCDFKGVDCLIQATAVQNLKVVGVSCTNLGAGPGASRSGIELTGVCDGLTLADSIMKGTFGAKHFYSDAAATVVNASITGMTFINDGGTGAALDCYNTSGVIANNVFIGFPVPSVSEVVTTTGSSISPGVINSLNKWDYTATVSGARQGDRVEIGTIDTEWPVPVGVEVQSFVSAPHTVTISYRNVTGAPIGVPPHDMRYCVIRGA